MSWQRIGIIFLLCWAVLYSIEPIFATNLLRDVVRILDRALTTLLITLSPLIQAVLVVLVIIFGIKLMLRKIF